MKHKKIKQEIKKLVPYGIVRYIANNGNFLRDILNTPCKTLKNVYELRNNKIYKNIYCGKRCFILCSGPSINKQKIELLKNEIVFGVSSGYDHPKYKTIQPKFHISPQFTYSKEFTNEIAKKHLKNMENAVAPYTELFFNITEKKIIEDNNFFKNNKVNYLYFNGMFESNENRIWDISGFIPGVQSVPIMGIILAMYMGFKEIYLVGTEHDSFITDKYEYAFKSAIGNKTDISVDSNGVVKDKVNELKSIVELFYQYRVLNDIAKTNSIGILNATLGGALEEFPRVDLEFILNDKKMVVSCEQKEKKI